MHVFIRERNLQKKKPSRILEVLHDSALGLHRAGTIDVKTMAEFDALCLSPVKAYTFAQIKKLRKRFNVSQPVLAAYLNTSPNTVKQWTRKPNSVSMKLLDMVDHFGLKVLVYD